MHDATWADLEYPVGGASAFLLFSVDLDDNRFVSHSCSHSSVFNRVRKLGKPDHLHDIGLVLIIALCIPTQLHR